jgi:membrane protein DedA with SNARE-associated domain
MAASLTEVATGLVQSLGYGGLTFGLTLDSSGIPIPSEVLIPLAAAGAKVGRLDLWLVILVSTLAQTAGGIIAYYIGAKGGLPLIDRYGKYFLVSHHEAVKVHNWFERYGTPVIIGGRCLPVVRGYIGFVAGIAEMPVWRYIAASAVGSLGWTLILVAAGWTVAGNIDSIAAALKPASAVIIVLLAAGAAFYLSGKLRKKNEA